MFDFFLKLEISDILKVLTFLGSIVYVSYLALNYIYNSDNEDSKRKVSVNNLKSMNFELISIIILFFISVFIGYMLSTLRPHLNFTVSFLVWGAITISIYYFYKISYLNKFPQKFIIQSFPSIYGIICGFLFYDFNYIISICIILSLIALINAMGKYNYEHFKCTQLITFNSKKRIRGYIQAESNDEIFVEIDKKMHRYKKSDIFCIQEL